MKTKACTHNNNKKAHKELKKKFKKDVKQNTMNKRERKYRIKNENVFCY